MSHDHIFKCMSWIPDDLVLMCVKAPTGDHKIADHCEVTPHHVLSQLANQSVFKVQSVGADGDEGIYILHSLLLLIIIT